MLTETHGRDVTRRHVIIYASLLVPVAIGRGFTTIGGPIYLTTSVVLNLWFVKGAYDIWCRKDADADADNYAVEKQVFKVSLYYLFLHFGALLAEAALRASGSGGW
jgi:protoheme IX farnesyltransferase